MKPTSNRNKPTTIQTENKAHQIKSKQIKSKSNAKPNSNQHQHNNTSNQTKTKIKLIPKADQQKVNII